MPDRWDLRLKGIPISAARQIAWMYGYDQVIILGRKTGRRGYEKLMTYGVTPEHQDIATRIGNFLKQKVMNWKNDE